VIGQGCEFDYSGVQACKVLRREGYRIILVNSNPATIMTDPEFADATYIEPLTVEIVEKIIAFEKPDALLSTVGGQTGLNLAMDLHRAGVLEKYGVQLIGAKPGSIDLAEDRQKFKEAMIANGLNVPQSDVARSLGDAASIAQRVGYPCLIRDYTERLGLALGARGLMNVQYAIKDDVVYVLEVNPRASRTVPFVSKATGVPIPKLAVQVMAGKTLEEINFVETPSVDGFFVKEVVLPFKKFPGAEIRLGPEMRSTGEVMGHASRFGHAFAKAQMAAGTPLPVEGSVLITVNDFDKGAALKIARDFHRLGFKLLATRGTADWLSRNNIPVTAVNKVSEGSPHLVEMIERGEIQLIINTPLGRRSYQDTQSMRAAAIRHNIPLVTTLSAAAASVNGIELLQRKELSVRSLQRHHRS
jgi:carbamoylphosphate synthase large subunit